jgi:trehalose-6-phosphate synthase
LLEAWEKQYREECGGKMLWWSVDGNKFHLDEPGSAGFDSARFDESLVWTAYKEGNEVIWPGAHLEFQRAVLDPGALETASRFCKMYARAVANRRDPRDRSPIVIHDYQLAEMTDEVRQLLPGVPVEFFLHIPIPDHGQIPAKFLPRFRRFFAQMLRAGVVGLQTERDRESLYQHLEDQVGVYRVNRSANQVIDLRTGQISICAVSPVQVCAKTWEARARKGAGRRHALLSTQKIVLSVDRIDYMKNALGRLHVIRRVFERRPDWYGTVGFAFVSERSRKGIEEFDNYFNAYCAAAAEIDRDFPGALIRVPQLSQDELGESVYPHAEVLWLSGKREGMGLTPKEYVPCQIGDTNRKVIIPHGLGAGFELFPEAVAVTNPADVDHVADVMIATLEMDPAIAAANLLGMQHKLSGLSPLTWRKGVRGIYDHGAYGLAA